MSYDDPENLTPEECKQLAEFLNVMELGDQQEKLERLWHADPVGMVAFGHDDQWIDKRL
jgi:hypothetical protein